MTDWKIAENHLVFTEDAYESLLGAPGVDVRFALGAVAAVRLRFDSGERTDGLYQTIMELE